MWKTLRRLIVGAPEDRWDWDLLFVPSAVSLGVWVGGTQDNYILGLGVAALIWGLREVLFRYFVKGRR